MDAKLKWSHFLPISGMQIIELEIEKLQIADKVGLRQMGTFGG
jgi:hypothetical protein